MMLSTGGGGISGTGGSAGPAISGSDQNDGSYHPVAIGGLNTPVLPDGFFTQEKVHNPVTGVVTETNSPMPSMQRVFGSNYTLYGLVGLVVISAAWLIGRR